MAGHDERDARAPGRDGAGDAGRVHPVSVDEVGVTSQPSGVAGEGGDQGGDLHCEPRAAAQVGDDAAEAGGQRAPAANPVIGTAHVDTIERLTRRRRGCSRCQHGHVSAPSHQGAGELVDEIAAWIVGG